MMPCPHHERVATCGCGLNWYCPQCHEGAGALPCNCPHGVRVAPDFDEPMELIESRRLRSLESLKRAIEAFLKEIAKASEQC